MEKYEKYKDSGVEWLGEIPEHWTVKRLKHVFEGKNTVRVPLNSEERGNMIDKKYNYYGASGVIDQVENYLFDEETILIGEDGANLLTRTKKLAFIASGKYWVNNHAHILKPKTGNINYLCELLEMLDYTEYISGSAQPKLTQEALFSIEIFEPPTNEQNEISAFLDKKTSELDTLITKKEKLIELLKEERTAIINQAVTKGLDPNVEMKDSGVEWLGEIPAHWKMSKLKYVSLIKYGLGQPPKQKDDGLPIIRATNVFRGKISRENLVFVDPDDIPCNRDPVLKENDIIVVRSGAYTGDSAIIPYEFDGAITGYDMVLRALTVNPKFVAFCLLSTYLLDNQLFLERLRAAQPHLNAEELGNSFLILPNLEEQDEIVSHIEIEHKRVDDLISKTIQEIILLREYKTALISEVVTGKVKVV